VDGVVYGCTDSSEVRWAMGGRTVGRSVVSPCVTIIVIKCVIVFHV